MIEPEPQPWSEDWQYPAYQGEIFNYPQGHYGPPPVFVPPVPPVAPRPRRSWLFYLFIVLAALSLCWTLLLCLAFARNPLPEFLWGGAWTALWVWLAWRRRPTTKRSST